MKKLLFILALSSTVASAQWVQKTSCKKDAAKILNSIRPPSLKFHEISKDVNNPINNDPVLTKPIN